MEKYIAVYSKNYTESDVIDCIEANNVVRHYSPQTYWEPGEDYVEFDTYFTKEFNDIVKIATLYFFGEHEENLDYPFAIVVDGLTFCLGENEDWESTLKAAGWLMFQNELSEEYEDNTEAVKTKIEDWANNIAEEKAWEYIENLKYGDY